MNTIFINFIFFIFTLIIFVKTIGYAMYEIRHENNLYGGIAIIVFCFISIIFYNIVVLTH